jgi:hypothetical protein
MKGAARRALRSWTARATTSFPVPLSPVISADASVDATSDTSRCSSCIVALRPSSPDTPSSPSIAFSSARTSRVRSRSAVTESSTARSFSCSTGLVRKSTAPSFIASTASSIRAWAVIRITGMCRCVLFLRRRSSSNPVTPGMRTSESTRSGSKLPSSASASATLAASRHW